MLLATAFAAGGVAAPSPAPAQAQAQQPGSPAAPTRTEADSKVPAQTEPAARRADPDAAPATTPPAVVDVAAELQRLETIVRNPTARQSERDDAAARLVSRQSPRADAILRDVLDGAAPTGKLAVARALADDPAPAEAFINSLGGALLGAGEQLSVPLADAAAQALATYRRNPVSIGYLVRAADRDSNLPPAVRAAAARSMGRVVDRASAEALVQLLVNAPANEPSEVLDAAAEALIEMTGLTENGRDARRWAQWWQQAQANAANNPDRWRADLLEARAARLEATRRRYESLVADTKRRLSAQYQAAETKEQRLANILDFLNSPEPDIRAIGTDFVTFAMQEQNVSDALRSRLVAMVGDSDARVRLRTAETLQNMNFAGALGALLTQVAQEQDERVRVALVGAIAPIGDPAAVPTLLELLNNARSPAVSMAAVRALGYAGRTLRTADPALAARVSARLQNIVRQRGRAALGGEELRVAALDALAPLKDQDMVSLGRALLTKEDSSPAVRQATLRVLGELGDRLAADTIIDVLQAEHRDPNMRKLALDALGKSGGLEYAQILYNFMQPRNEPDPTVQEAAWQAFRGALPRATDDQLVDAARLLKPEPARHIYVAQTLAERFRQQRKLDEWAAQLRNIADDEMSLPTKSLASAAEHYTQALTYWLDNKGAPQTIDELTEKALSARLEAAQYVQAAAFAESAIKRQDLAGKEVVGRVIKNEADTLRTKRDFKKALELIDAALKMNPALDERHQTDLKTIRADIEATMSAGSGAAPPADNSAVAPADKSAAVPAENSAAAPLRQ
jgi:HEAT repeat protein